MSKGARERERRRQAGKKKTSAERSAEIVDIVCGEVSPEVAERVRRVAEKRVSVDPNFWGNVMLRESWYVDHGSYDEWDRVARAGGHDPDQYGPIDG